VEVEHDKQLSTVFTKEHVDIHQVFKNKIVGLLRSPEATLKSYAIDSTYEIRECLKLKIGEIEVELTIKSPNTSTDVPF